MKKRILIIADTSSWAIARNVDAIVNRLGNKYDFDKAQIRIEIEKDSRGYRHILKVDVRAYDLVILRTILNFHDGEYGHVMSADRSRLVATIASHHGWGYSKKQFMSRIGDFKHVFCVSDGIYDKAIEKIKGRDHSFYYTPQGVETNLFRDTPHTQRDKLRVGWAGNCAHGWEHDHKRFYGVIIPLAIAMRDKYDFRFAARNMRPEIAAMLDSAGIAHKNIGFNGMAEYYNGLDVFLNASKSEAIASTTVEAIACGVPVITTPVGHAKNIIVNGKSGFIIGGETNTGLVREFTESLEAIGKMDAGKLRWANRFIAKNIYDWDILISHTDMAISEALR